MKTERNILVINPGSSSDKISFFALPEDLKPEQPPKYPLWQDEFDFSSGTVESVDWQSLLERALNTLLEQKIENKRLIEKITDIDIIGHRVVHGGDKYSCAAIIDKNVRNDIETLIPLAPLHNKISLMNIKALEKLLPKTQQIAVFDTAFHHTLPDEVSFYPLPYQWREQYGIRRFGFHGINHEYCNKEAARLLNKNIENFSTITCHLGSGCSLAAIQNGKSVNTTMGFTPLEGLMMATRSGSIDPSILLFLLKNQKISINELEHTLNKNSGLLGISQITSNMKVIIEKMQSTDAKADLAKLAFDMFISRLRASICAMRASLPQLDALIFTGGIGENSSLVREKACAGLDFLNVKLDSNANNNREKIISDQNSKTIVLVIKAGEDVAIAEQALAACK